jgi:hypothetical protein
MTDVILSRLRVNHFEFDLVVANRTSLSRRLSRRLHPVLDTLSNLLYYLSTTFRVVLLHLCPFNRCPTRVMIQLIFIPILVIGVPLLNSASLPLVRAPVFFIRLLVLKVFAFLPLL